MSFGKIDVTTNYLMSSQKNKDGTWLPLTDFVVDPHGDYWTYYIDPTTPDTDKNMVESDGKVEVDKELLISEITVDFTPQNETEVFTFCGSEAAQSKLLNAASRIKGGGPNKTQNVFDVLHKPIKLTTTDIDAILALIEPLQEAIVNA